MPLGNQETPAEREARRLIAQSHERELAEQLAKLEADFAGWRAGKLSPHALVERVRAFHEGPARTLHKRYVESEPMNALAHAVLSGVIKSSEIPAEMRDEVNVALTILKFKR